MGYALLLGGIFIVCSLVSGSVAKSVNDRKHQPLHLLNQKDIKDLTEQKCALENRIKGSRELTAEEIHRYNVEIERIGKILKGDNGC
jgi:hypothetical protein